jgi:ABC-type uncharacterized transport system substrate-binding protein
MRRRQFIALFGGVATWPLFANAQQPKIPVVGYLSSESADRYATRLSAFRQGLRATGFEEGRNVSIEYRWAEGQTDRILALAADLVRRQVTVIAAPGSITAALAAKAATTTIPIVFETGADPITTGLVKSLNRPEGNVTGITSLNLEIGAKRLQLLRELVPQAKSFAVLLNPTNPLNVEITKKNLEDSSQALELQLHFLNASTERELETAFARLAQLRVGGLLVGSDTFFNNRAQQLAELTLKHSVPTVFQAREFTAAGGLVSYGGNVSETHGQAGVYTGRILKGERPADLPVQQVTKIELIINLRTAKSLGINVPNTLIGRADEVIE